MMVEKNLISSKVIENKNSLYYIHYKTENEIKELNFIQPTMDDFFDEDNIESIWFYLIVNHSILSKNNWELHKKYMKEGINPNEISKIIRNDEIEKLQEISTQNDFDINQIIEPSPYERCSFINQNNVSLIDYAAFFGSIKCFKYLMLNGANTSNTIVFAVAGGNIEILHLCEQTHELYEELCKFAIIFHRNDIFYYVYNKIEVNYKVIYMSLCISLSNYEILSFFIKEEYKINDILMHNLVVNGNINLIEEFKNENNFPDSMFVSTVKSRNIELVKYFMKQNSYDINVKYINYFYL